MRLRRRKLLSLATRMDRINWAIQRIDADEGSLRLLGYDGPLPVLPPFGWHVSEDRWEWVSPALANEPLKFGRLTPEQMSFCLELEAELAEWAKQVRDLRDEHRKIRDLRDKAESKARKEREAEKQRAYERAVLDA